MQPLRLLILLSLLLPLLALPAQAASLPGFRVERLALLEDFPTSLTVDSRGTIYYTARKGTLYSIASGASEPVLTVVTEGFGNSGLLGVDLVDDHTAVIHYTTPNQTHDVIALADLRTGEERLLVSLPGDIEVPERGTSTEHHGGNPHVAPDGTIWVGIGEYGGRVIATLDAWNGGKIFRITPDGRVTKFARGLRNPFDLAWDAKRGRLIVADNGPIGGDEIHIIEEGVDLGWPWTWGDEPPIAGAVPPDYVFPQAVAPTGMLLASDRARPFSGGILLGTFVNRAIYFFPDLDARPLQPLVVLERETDAVIDIAEGPRGDIYFVTGSFQPGRSALYRLITPQKGDCDGDGLLSAADVGALARELEDSAAQPRIQAQGGAHRGSWGCDANDDGMITAADAVDLMRLVGGRRRSVSR